MGPECPSSHLLTSRGGKPPFTLASRHAILERSEGGDEVPDQNKMPEGPPNNTLRAMTETLRQKLLSAEICCRDCGARYGKYSVGVSSTWEGDCDVCGEHKGVTEVRDWGYLSKGLAELGALKTDPFAKLTESFPPERKAKIKEQSKVVASYMASVGPIMTDDELEDALTASYEVGELTMKLTEDEIAYLNHCLDVISDAGVEDEDQAMFVSIEKKICELYEDNCVKYELAPAMKAYYAKFTSYGNDDEEDRVRWATFRDAFNAGLEYSKEAQ